MLKRVFEFSFLSGGRKNEKIVRLFLRSFVVREKKNLPDATFRKQIAVFWAPNISFLPAAHGFITSHALLRYYYCRHNNKKKEKQESKKGPKEREREFVRIVRCPSSSSVSLFIITREEEEHTEEEHIFEFAVKNLGIPPSVAST